MSKMLNYSRLAGLAALFGGWTDGYNGPRVIPDKKKYRKCGLPGCEIITSHNGGHCCGQHSKLHDELRRANLTSHNNGLTVPPASAGSTQTAENKNIESAAS